jgi:hypothetical protein
MPDTLGEVWRLGWTATAHCYWFGPSKRGRAMLPWCDSKFELDMLTLVLTRGERFPLARIDEVMMCPKCGLRKVRVLFSIPKTPKPMAVKR